MHEHKTGKLSGIDAQDEETDDLENEEERKYDSKERRSI